MMMLWPFPLWWFCDFPLWWRWCGTLHYEVVTLSIMMYFALWWCGTLHYDDVTVSIMMMLWPFTLWWWWCGAFYYDNHVILPMIMIRWPFLGPIMMIMWPFPWWWWCNTFHDDDDDDVVLLCIMMMVWLLLLMVWWCGEGVTLPIMMSCMTLPVYSRLRDQSLVLPYYEDAIKHDIR